jgi:hypothetical protein
MVRGRNQWAGGEIPEDGSMSKRNVAVLTIMMASVTIACSDSIAPPKAASLEANSEVDQQAFAGFPGAFAGEDPEVLVRDDNGRPVAGIPVRFTVTAGGGSVANATTISGPQGRATAGTWTLGSSFGLNTLVGSVDGVGSVQFRTMTVPVPTGTYQLATIDGAALPFTDIWSNHNWAIIGGTFILGSDRTYSYVLRVRTLDGAVVEQDKISGAFAPRKPTGLSFFSNGWPWVEGAVQGDTLVAYIWDFSDFTHPYVFVRERSQ